MKKCSICLEGMRLHMLICSCPHMGKDKLSDLLNNQVITFKYPEISYSYYNNKHCIYDNNKSQHKPKSLECTKGTKNWEHFGLCLPANHHRSLCDANRKVPLQHRIQQNDPFQQGI